jgi:cytochrome c biogenesis protein CcmG, thiol:disulfide interchange protein DsbE
MRFRTGPASAARRGWLRRAAGLALTAAAWPVLDACAANLKLGEPAPPLVLHTLDGRSISTRDLIGKVVIVTFWATWCEPCREELPLLSAYAARHAQEGLQVLGFSLDGPEDLPKVRAVGANLSFPVGLLGSPWAGAYGRIWRIPVSFVIDRAGRLAENGWNAKQTVWTAASLRKVIGPLLADCCLRDVD